ncbi:MAG: isoaspartyl peptidase/L-asparaginase [Planctomycetota bacterium]|nr:isoaspartyl peptidase/L-asparaginase [Planctomycetota bacterium]
MKRCKSIFVLFLSMFLGGMLMANEKQPEYAIVIHGGAGSATTDPVMIANREEILQKALKTGVSILEEGGTSLDAVESVIRILEDSPLFNAGRGGVLTAKGTNELDATIMDGRTRACGAVGGVTTVKNPISLARRVMTETRHVLLVSEGADQFAAQLDDPAIEIVAPEYFRTEKQVERLKRVKEREKLTTKEKMGTVGCVALDRNGNLAAGTSTGGLVNKKHGRLGDSPIIGAGTYANNTTCGISCTGVGEDFIRHAIAYDIHARMHYGKQKLESAVEQVLKSEKYPIVGGVIGIDLQGSITMQFNTDGMARAAADSTGLRVIKAGK